MTILDMAVLAILIVFGIVCAYKGFIRACLGFLPTWVALIGTYFLYPTGSKILRQTPIFDKLRDGVGSFLNLDTLLSEQAMKTQTELISSIQVPEFLKAKLIENNNPVIYQLLDVESISDYITGFLANICMNILAMILVFLVLYIASKLILSALDLVAKLPILSAFNRFCGLVVGLARGVVWLWVAGIAFTFFYYSDWAQPAVQMLLKSPIALWLYENNWLLFMILKIFT